MRRRPTTRRIEICLLLIAALPLWSAEFQFENIADDQTISEITLSGTIGTATLNDNGEVAFSAVRREGGARVVMIGSGGAIRTLLDTTDRFEVAELLGLNNRGIVLLLAVGRTSFLPSLYTTSGAELTEVPMPQGEFPTLAAFLNDNGDLAWVGSAGVRIRSSGATRTIPEALGGAIGRLNELGELVYIGRKDGQNWVRKDVEGRTVDIAQQSPEFGLATAIRPVMNDAGVVVVNGIIDNRENGLFRLDEGRIGVVARSPALSYAFPDVNNSGTVALAPFDRSGAEGIYIGSHTPEGKVIARGDALFGSRVVGIRQASPRFLNNRGQIAFIYHLANGVNGVAIATPVSTETPAIEPASTAPPTSRASSAAHARN